MKRALRLVIQGCALPAVPLMWLYAWTADDGLTIGRAGSFAWSWWLGFWDVVA